MIMDEEYIYYSSDEDDSNSSYEDEHLTGGIRARTYVQAGNNAVSAPYHLVESVDRSGGKFKMKSVAKKVGKVAKPVAKSAIKEAKPIVIAEGKKALKEGIKSMLASENGSAATGGRRKKRDLVRSAIDDVEDLGYVIKREDAEKKRLGRKLDVMDGGKVYRDGFIRGVEYANQHGGKIHWGKVAKKVVKNPVARGVISGAVGDGVTYMTDNPAAGMAAASAVDGGLKGLGRTRGGGRGARGAIVSKVMKEKGLSLPQASKYVKDHNLY